MKILLSIILTALLSFACCLYLPWWTIAIVAFVVALIFNPGPGKAFISGFIALFLLWGTMSFLISSSNDHVLAHKVSVLVLKADNPYMLILVTALIGAVVAGCGAMAGSFVRSGDNR